MPKRLEEKPCDASMTHENADGYSGNCKTWKSDDKGKRRACSGPHPCTLGAGHAGDCDFGDVTTVAK